MNKNSFPVGVIFLTAWCFNACSASGHARLTQPPQKLKQDTVVVANTMGKDSLLENLLQSKPVYFNAVLQNQKALKVQIIYTQINRGAGNEPFFKQYHFNTDSAVYFYPASTVKLPVAMLALQKLHELNLPGLDKNSSLITDAAYSKQTQVFNDPGSADGRPSVAQYIKRIFMVSDNNAFNRLYEFTGQQYINDQLHRMGYADAEILHRLQISMTPDENRHANPVGFYSEDGKILYTQPMQFNKNKFSARNDSIGSAYYNGSSLINQPMNFSGKNRVSLQDLTDVLKSVLFPQSVLPKQRFNFTEDDYRFVRQYLSEWPTESIYPPYSADTTAYWPAYGKFLLFGAEKGPVPNGIRIFNKIGGAYGFLEDVAYIVDFDNQVEFMLSAEIYCNADGILNDDKYDYNNVGFPFMKQLGKLIYEYELARPRAVKPDLSTFKMTYDK